MRGNVDQNNSEYGHSVQNKSKNKSKLNICSKGSCKMKYNHKKSINEKTNCDDYSNALVGD